MRETTAEQKKAKASLIDKNLVDYFRHFSKENERFIIEHKIVAATIDMVAPKLSFVTADFISIADCSNQIIGKEHYSGSGWYDFQLRMSRFFFTFGHKSEWNSATGEFTCWRDSFLFWIGLWNKLLNK